MEAGSAMWCCASARRASLPTRLCWPPAASTSSRCSAARRRATATPGSWRCTRSARKFSKTSWTSRTPPGSWCGSSASRSWWQRPSSCWWGRWSRSVRRSSNSPTSRSSSRPLGGEKPASSRPRPPRSWVIRRLRRGSWTEQGCCWTVRALLAMRRCPWKRVRTPPPPCCWKTAESRRCRCWRLWTDCPCPRPRN